MGSVAAELAFAAAGVVGPLTGAMPSPLWSGADRVLLSCSADAAAAAALGRDWCALALAEARRDAPMPVDPAAGEPGDRSTLTLAIAAADGAISVTVARALSIDDAEGVFHRRGPALPPGAAADPQVRAALAVALDDALPWRRKPERRPMRRLRTG